MCSNIWGGAVLKLVASFEAKCAHSILERTSWGGLCVSRNLGGCC